VSLYHAQFDGESYYIEARNFHGAIDTWKRHVAKAWGQNFDGTEEPESVALIHEEAVLRESEAPTEI